MLTLADRIIVARKALGISQVRLGELVNRSTETIIRWEKQHTQPSAADVVPLSRALQVDPNTLLGWE
jgi:transcriptional regulator with XRE-family HTH domain